MKQSFLLAAFLLAFGGLASSSAHAQAPGTGGPTAVPLDGGASLRLASGVAYGQRRLRA